MVERLFDSMVEYLVMMRVVEMVELKAKKKVIESAVHLVLSLDSL